MSKIGRTLATSASLALVVLLSGCEAGNARWVSAEEISGGVVDAATGNPISDAIVAIRFERNNTGHSGPHCFRSMAVKTDATGRFRFKPWKQENTQANYAMGEVTAYKVGFTEPSRGVYIHQATRSFGGISFSDTIVFRKVEITVKLVPFLGRSDERMRELQRLVDNFTCRWQAEFEDMVLLHAIQDEIVASPFANERFTPEGFTPRSMDPTHAEWIRSIINTKSPR